MTSSHQTPSTYRIAPASAHEPPAAYAELPELHRWFFEHSGEGVVLGTAGGAVVHANPAACALLGQDEEELRAGAAPTPLARALVLAAGRAATVARDVALRRPDGTTVALEMSAAALPSSDDPPLVCVRLRERERDAHHGASAPTPADEPAGADAAAEEDASNRAWLEAIPAIAWRTDEHAQIVERNRHWFEFTGRPRDDASGVDWLEVIHEDDRMRLVTAVQSAVAAAGPLECEFRVRRADGVYRWFLGRALPVRDRQGRVTGWMGIGTDIEDRKRAEQALQEADRRKNEFLGVLSHELRNPLTPIATAVYLLDHADPGGEQARASRDIIGRQVTHLRRLVDDLLDVTRIIRGKVELRRVRLDLNDVVRRAGEDHRAVLTDHGVALAVDIPEEPFWVDGDETRIAQIVGNLLLNAAKFTPTGGRVALGVRRGTQGFEIHVKDNGTGIAADLLQRVFEPFAQGPQGLARTSGGLGLGLALVKGLTELHGGAVQALSEGVGRGAEIVVALPAALAASPRRAEPTGTPTAGRQRAMRVLVVDDHPDTAECLAQVVELAGHAAEIALDGTSAIAQAAAYRPDVVLCDIGLPGKNGYEVARALRSGAGGEALTLVAISGYAQPEDVKAALDAGFDRHLAKPPDLGEIQDLLVQCARDRQGAEPRLASIAH